MKRKLGNLERCLKALKKNKLENTIIGIIDNASKDKSVRLIEKYVKNKTVDVFIQSGTNLGKPKALNALFKYMLRAYTIMESDICIHLDSDIKIYDNFILEAENCFKAFNDDCYLFVSKGSSEELEYKNDGGHLVKDDEFIEVNDDLQKLKKGPGLQGCCWALKCTSFIDVNFYRETCRKK